MALRTAAGLAAVCLLCLVGYAAWAARESFPAPPGRPVVAGSRLSAFSVAAEEERGPGTPTAPASLQRDINMLPQNSSSAAALGPGFGGVRDADDTGAYRDPADTLAADIAACTRHGSAGISGFVHLRVRHGAAHVPGLSDGSITGAPDYEEVDPDTHVFPFRLPEVPGEKTFQDMEWCPGSLEPEVEEVPPIDPAYRMLFVIGAQKAGTTWLAHNVARHPSVVYGQSHLASKAGRSTKELQFFNTWPAPNTSEFLSMWPEDELEAMRNGTSLNFLFDGSPEYLLNAAVPPRIKQMIPHAKIMIILRDPTDRAFSSWSMNANWDSFCDKEDKSVATLCVERTFRDTFNAWHNSFSRPECRFTTPGSNASWGQCFGCRYNLFRYKDCCELRQEHGEAMFPCFGVPRGFSVLDYSSYAAQIAWWLEFFPPEQMFVVTSNVLKDRDRQTQILNDMLDFAGVPNAPRFDEEEVRRTGGFPGVYSDLSTAEVETKRIVRTFHTSQRRDLRALLMRYFPNAPYIDLSEFDWKDDMLTDDLADGPADAAMEGPVEGPMEGLEERLQDLMLAPAVAPLQ